MLGLYRYHADCGRMGELYGLFVAEIETVDKNIGKDVHFGEVLGKHSDVCGILTEDELELMSADQENIEWLVEISGSKSISGYNPLDYIQEGEEDE